MKRPLVACVQALTLLACASGAKPPQTGPARETPLATTAAPSAGSAEDDAAVPIAATDPVWGSRTAPVTILEFADFECPFCARAEPALTRIREKYGPAQVRFLWKHAPLPFHPRAQPAAEAAAGVYALRGSEGFWRFHDEALHAQNGLTEDAFVGWAHAAGVADLDAFRAGLKAHAWAAKVDADAAEAKRLGANGTPWFFVNGVKLVGAQPESAFIAIIDAQLVAAENKIAAGVAPDRIYAVLSRENFSQPSDDDEAPPEDATLYDVPIGKSPARGSAEAPVTIIEFADFQCPYCARAAVTIQELRAQYGDKLRIVLKNEPLAFHPRAEPAAEAALEVRAEKGDAAFWAMHDALFSNLAANHADLRDDALVELAESAGARADLVRAAIGKHRYAAEIEADVDLADAVGADGTPHFFVNGRRLAGAQPKEKFTRLIDQELKKADALVTAGTAPAAVYAALMKDAVPPPEPERKDVGALPAGDPARGAAHPRVIVHEFADFQCPFCVRAEAALREVAKNYPREVRFVWHDLPLPFHENATPAARAAREAQAQRGDGAFWDLHDRFLVEDAKLSRTDLDNDARALGLDMTKWSASLESGSRQASIDADRDAAIALGFSGTPSFVIAAAGAKTGYVLMGAQDYSKFQKLIERARAEAK